ncbi:23S rRNA (uracil(747)-C(5))-methyltransferase RlmC [Nocardioides sp. InS609-2]|uniref:23S rRNA (uracil(747)-C(5))-methyltransferase RlmC n=1 Tax=Nocardioides sp. InS609-2 TaxID=2760705 RepID=UPI0020BEC88A|nr:23S rRNA (uracil(747)-C(5))-methyltransferase RlmC [Nocardioides sp. InS609-2]
MECHHYDAFRCRSCTLLEIGYDDQVRDKELHCRSLVASPGLTWLPAVTGPESAFRNKAKMVVAGTVDAPTIGILDPSGDGVDLRDCGLHSPGLQAVLPVLATFVATARLAPYDIGTRQGELKHLLVTEAPSGELMVRFVLRSQEPVTRIRKHLPVLLDELPQVCVVSVNLQPEHKAVLEGEREIVLTPAETLTMRVGDLDLHLQPQSFFQTNTVVATSLYQQAASWVSDLAPASLWDLYCGVGGFALHCGSPEEPRDEASRRAAPGREVTGIEVSTSAVESAALTAAESGLTGVTFVAADATAYAVGSSAAPELVIVNPPRRGIGPELATWLEASDVRHVVYSSCNAESLARDLALMPSLRPVEAVLLDMFPQTRHYEVMMLLSR